MKEKLRSAVILSLTIVVLLLTSSHLPADTGTCGGAMVTLPFTDVAGNGFFCQIAEAYFSGLTNGTTPTTYSPSANVPREQMAAFVTRTQDSALRRGNRRAALNQWATPTSVPLSGRTSVGGRFPREVKSDGTDLWVAVSEGLVKRVRASDGLVLGTWTGATNAFGVLVARGRVYVTGNISPGPLYRIDPSQPPGVVTTLSSTLGNGPLDITTDGQFIWTANAGGSISRVDPDTGATTTFTAGFNSPFGILFDGTNLWVTDNVGLLRKLDSSGAVVQNVAVGANPQLPVFDGSNIWVPISGGAVTVVRARDAMVLATLTGNGLNDSHQAAFDGQRVLVTNGAGFSASMWNAADLTPIGSFDAGVLTVPYGACSDGINFWVTLLNADALARF
jgi:DNA-binding beta-propeller fold protein YncE